MQITPENTLALLVDIQEKLFPHIYNNEELLSNASILLQGLKCLNITIVVNEQYKKGLGETIEPLKEILGTYESYEKVTFSCCKTDVTLEHIKSFDKKYIILTGVETHICVLQSALDLLAEGMTPVIVTDCVSSRKVRDTEIALKRLEKAGAILTTYESILFELCISAKNPAFKSISQLVK